MYVRARPYIDKVNFFDCMLMNTVRKPQERFNELYFDSGSSALEWFLLEQSKSTNKKLKVGVQVFTCSTVNDAIKNSHCTPVYIDIDMIYLTTLYAQLEEYQGRIDILILTHLFGIANPEYLKIKEWCTQNNIVLINDLALTVHSKIDNKTIESYGDYYVYSFAFDKPLSAGFGGMLKIKDTDSEMLNNYNNLEFMSDGEYVLKMKLFYLYYLLTSPKIYHKEFRRNSCIEHFIVKYCDIEKLNKSILYKFLSSKLNYVVAKFFTLVVSSKSKKNILRMNKYHYTYIASIMEKADFILGHYATSFNIMKDRLLHDHDIKDINMVHSTYGQRYTVLIEERDNLILKLKKQGIESGCHNWAKLICEDQQACNFPNALKVIKTLVNIPIWSPKIWKN